MHRLALLLLALSCAWSQPAAVVLQGGRVIDPRNQVDAVRDVLIVNGRIERIAERIQPPTGARLADVGGLIITPGLIDLHVHVFYNAGIPDAWAGDNSVAPDSFSFRTCTTTMVDAGSSGWRNFSQFRSMVIDRAQTRVLAFLNIAGFGMMTDHVEQDPADFQPDRAAAVIEKNRDVIVGIKAAHYQKPDWTQIDRAVEAGRLTRLPVMVDFGYFLPQRPYWQLVTEKLRPGDISTHCFRAPVPWVDENGKLYSYLLRARERGVKFDVGHGGGSFAFRNAVPAISQGFYPDSISTDLHKGSQNAGLMDLPTTMSKLMAIGLPLPEAILRATWNPARIIGRSDLGHLSPGAEADIAIFRLEEGNFGFRDSDDGRVSGRQRLTCEMTFKAGRPVWDWNSRLGVDYRNLGPNYGVRPVEQIVRPPR